MQNAQRQMHEERFDRPEDEREDFERDDASRSASGDSDVPEQQLFTHANREATRRKTDASPARGLGAFIDKHKVHPLAAGLGYQGDPSDELLFLQYREGNDEAFLAIYERYKSSIYAYCAHVLLGVGMSREMVEDTFQDVFLRLVQYRHTFTGGDFKPWLFTVTRHSCLTAKRKFWRDHDSTDRSKDLSTDADSSEKLRQAIAFTDDPLERMSKTEQVALLLAAIAKLPDEFREALTLSEYEELRYEEIAQVLGVSMSTVRIRIFRAKAKLRKMLVPLFDTDASGDRDANGPKGNETKSA
ncbi:MAG TPA: RNA polymerase sigma factor [Candidatus Kapabacteria bacterium]